MFLCESGTSISPVYLYEFFKTDNDNICSVMKNKVGLAKSVFEVSRVRILFDAILIHFYHTCHQ